MKNLLKIGIIMQSPDWGGAEKFMISLMEEFKKENIKLFVASNPGKFFNKSKNITTNTTQVNFVLDIMGNFRGLIKTIIILPYAVFFYSRILRKYKSDGVNLILMSNFSEKLLVSIISIFIKIPVFWIEYGPMEAVLKRNFYIPYFTYQLLKNIPIKIIVPSENTKTSLLRYVRVQKENLVLIPCGTTLKESYRKKIGKEIIVGSVSRLSLEKGQEILINTMPRVLKEVPNCKLLIVGSGPSQVYYSKLVSDMGLSKNILITGFVKSIEDYYKKFDIFCFSSVWELEGFGLVTIEAMSHGLPVIGPDTSPTNEIVINEKTGILITSSEKSYADAIIRLAKNKNLVTSMGYNGVELFRKKYEIKNISRQYISLFNQEISTKISKNV